MTATYVVADLSTSTTYQIRLILGDTDVTSALLQDEEIAFFYGRRGTVNGGAAMGARSISAKFSQLSDTAIGPQKFALSQKAANFKALADDLEKLDDATGGATPFCGGISIANKQTYESDNDRAMPAFVRNGTDFPISGNQALQNAQDGDILNDWY